MARPHAHERRRSREDVLRAARAEFAARGFTGAGVERIARRARVNKAMIYYHFGSKLGLYRRVVLEVFEILTARAREAVEPGAGAFEQLDAFVASLLRTTTDHPDVVPLLLREIASGGRHLDVATLRQLVELYSVLEGILAAGGRRREIADIDPVLTHFLIVGATMLYAANAPLRTRVRRLRLPSGPRRVPMGPEPFLEHMSLVLRRALARPYREKVHA
jgi:AcrR family transcriptional regulator